MDSLVESLKALQEIHKTHDVLEVVDQASFRIWNLSLQDLVAAQARVIEELTKAACKC